MSLSGIVSLSKCCFLLILLSFTHSTFGQNKITVKKKADTLRVATSEQKEHTPIDLSGFYYSEPYTLSTGTPGEPPTDFRRMFIYVDTYNQVYIFHSTKSVKKLYTQFLKNPDKLTEEYGIMELTHYGDIYINAKSSLVNYGSYKYVGALVAENLFYLDYKSSISSKVALKIYLHRY